MAGCHSRNAHASTPQPVHPVPQSTRDHPTQPDTYSVGDVGANLSGHYDLTARFNDIAAEQVQADPGTGFNSKEFVDSPGSKVTQGTQPAPTHFAGSLRNERVVD